MEIFLPIVPIVTSNGEGERWVPRRRTLHRCLCVVGAVVVCCLFFFLVAPVVVVFLWRILRPVGFTLEADPEGVTYHGPWRARRVCWDQVRRFSVEGRATGEGSWNSVVGIGGDRGPQLLVAESRLFRTDDLHDIAHWCNGWREQSRRAAGDL